MKIAMFSPYISEAAVARVNKVLRSGYIGEGPVVKELEDKFSQIVKAPYPVAVNSCTSALHLALVMAGVGPGDEVITTAQTMMATSHAILAQHARTVFADIQYLTGNINPQDLEKRITPQTKAIVVVHWAGYPCDLEEIQKLASDHNLPVIEDAAHTLGAVYKGRSIGSISAYTCFSFQAIKHITTGDGGMLCLFNEKDFQQAKRRRWYGIDRVRRKPVVLGEPEWNVTELGFKYHMNDIAAAMGAEHLSELRALLNRREEIVSRYLSALKDVAGVTLFERKPDHQSANWLFTMHVQRREDFARMMRDKGVEVSVVHLRIDKNDIFGPLRKDLPILDRFTQTHISIPLQNALSDEDVEYIIRSIKEGW